MRRRAWSDAPVDQSLFVAGRSPDDRPPDALGQGGPRGRAPTPSFAVAGGFGVRRARARRRYWGMASSAFTADRRRLTAMRLAAQRIAPGGPATPGQVVRSMLAMQGQDFPGARWSIGLRGHGLTDHEVGSAFDARDIVRSWPMRGTLHVVAAEDIGWMLALLAPRVIAATATRRAQLGDHGGRPPACPRGGRRGA